MKLRTLLFAAILPFGPALVHAHHAPVRVAPAAVATVPAGFVAVPFAVPVAMPSYVQYQVLESYLAVPSGSYAAVVKPPAGSATPADSAAPLTAAPAAAGLVAVHCGGCHGAVKPKAGLDLTAAIADDTRLRAIGRVLADDPQLRMPKGKNLTADQLGRLIQELSAAPATAKGAAAAPAARGADSSNATKRDADDAADTADGNGDRAH